MSSFRETILKILSNITGEKDVNLDISENSKFGEYSTNVVKALYRNLAVFLL